jgi:prepilin-type N-terminal cleavage/methylation domain-containing protein
MIKHKLQQQIRPSGESGFTIIESLVALLVVAILLTAIAPVIVLATATRVQSRRVELATQAAKTFIDGIRTGAIAAPSVIVTLAIPTALAPRKVSGTGSTPGDYLINSTDEMLPPTSSAGLYCFTRNGNITTTDCTDKPFEFYIQAAQIKASGSQPNDGYRLGIRVYRANADFPLTASDGTKKTQTPFTGGLGSRKAPLIEMTTDIGNSTTTFQALCKRLGIATNQTCQ